MVNRSNLENISYKVLSILIDQDGFSFYLHHIDSEDSLFIGKTKVEDVFSLNSLKRFKKQLSEITKSYSFENVKVAFANAYYAFVPTDYFIEGAKADYLKYNVELFEEDHITTDEINSLNLQQVYIPLMNYHNTILEEVEEFEYQHFTNYIIQDCQPRNFENDSFINIYIRESSFDLIAFEGIKFKLCNTFEYDTEFDLAYYVLFAVEELKFDQTKMQLNIYNDTETKSWLDILELYIKNISCKTKPLSSFIS